MLKFLKSTISEDKLAAAKEHAIELAESDDIDACWNLLRPLRRAQRHQRDVAECLVDLVGRSLLPDDKGLEILAEVFDAYRDDVNMMGAVGTALEGARDIDQLNLPPPEHPLFAAVIEALGDAWQSVGDDAELETTLLEGLSTAARMTARQHDDIAERSYQRLVELDPTASSNHYNLGLFYKTRGRFVDGMKANQTAASLSHEVVESYEWNTGICATGAGDAEVALAVWQHMQQKIEMGRFNLPDGGYPQCKVRLAERPLAERTADNDNPGLEETIWIERISPCHGIVRSVLFQELGVNYGDVVLIDGAPITYHKYGDHEYPVFPHLATLLHRNYRIFDFAGTQDETGRLEDASLGLDGDAIVYSHTENYQEVCANCWRDRELDHECYAPEEKYVVVGKIAAPAEQDLGVLIEQLDAAIADRDPCRLYAPELCRAAGLSDRAAIEQRRFDLLRNN
ncbi:MAG: prenyltransferase [Pseudomonadota bacterium]